MVALNNIKLILLYFSIVIFIACTGVSSSSDLINSGDIKNINNRLDQQSEKIEKIEQKLVSYQIIINNHSRINDEISQLKNIFLERKCRFMLEL